MRASTLRIVLALVAVTAAVAPRAVAEESADESPEAIFAQANALYEGGDFEEAVRSYAALVDLGVTDSDLFFNLGNAYYKIGQIGRAILFYERARRLAPRDGDVAANLSLARSLVRDRQFIRESGWLRRVIMWPHDNLSTRELFLLASAWYLVLCAALLGFIFRRSGVVSAIYEKLSVVSPARLFGLNKSQDFVLAILVGLFLFVLTTVSAGAKYHVETARPVGVVLDGEIAVYSSPSDDSTLQFKVHEGTEVKVASEHRGWVQLRLAGGLSGWVRAGAVDRI